MPKIYTEEEKNNIRRELREEAGRCLRLYGVRRTTVDHLVESVGIAKGSFYLFYPHKEALFLDLITSFEDGLEDFFTSRLQELDENHIVTSLTDVFTEIIMDVYRKGIFRLLDGNELDLVMRKYPEGERMEIYGRHLVSLKTLFAYFYIDDEDDIKRFSEGFSALMYILLHDEKIQDMEKTLRFLIRGLVVQMVE